MILDLARVLYRKEVQMSFKDRKNLEKFMCLMREFGHGQIAAKKRKKDFE